jgi:hypothetical protein
MSDKTDYVPSNDAVFKSFADNVYHTSEANCDRWGFPVADVHAMANAVVRWETAYAVASNPATRTSPAVQEKNDARRAYESLLRVFIQGHLQHNPRVTPADLQSMALPVHDTKPTPKPAPTTAPELTVDQSQQMQHKIRVRDTASKSTARPAGVVGFEIWRKIGGDSPANDVEWTLVGQFPRQPQLLTYPQSEQGLRVYYRLRWVNSRAEYGPWSETVSAIVS